MLEKNKKPRAILHIGLPKTGSTGLQEYLLMHTDELAANGVAYPKPLISSGHHAELLLLRRVTEPQAILDWHEPATRAADELEGGLSYLERTFRESIASTDSPDTIILSSEGLFEVLDTPERLAPLAQLFNGFEVTVIFYLRRIDQLIRSAILEHTKVVDPISESVIEGIITKRIAEHDAIETRLAYWQEVFGPESIVLRAYDRKVMKDGDVIADFFHAAGIDVALPAPPHSQANTSLAVETVYFMGDWLSFPIWGRSEFDRKMTGYLMEGSLQRKLAGFGSDLITSSRQRELVDRFQPMYCRLAERYGLPELFAESKPDGEAPSKVFGGLTYQNARPIFEHLLHRFHASSVEAKELRQNLDKVESEVARLSANLYTLRPEKDRLIRELSAERSNVEALQKISLEAETRAGRMTEELNTERRHAEALREFRPDRSPSNLWRFLRKREFRGIPKRPAIGSTPVEENPWRAMPPENRVVAILRSRHLDAVIDVGAAHGEYTRGLRSGGYTGKVICAEPLPDVHEILTRRTKELADVVILPRTAVGAEEGSAEINVAGNRVSSSILPMLDTHRNAAPQSAYVDVVATPVTTLDRIFAEHVPEAERVFVKIDTQGYEGQVLAGLRAERPRLIGLQIELSLTPLYEGQVLWRELIKGLCDEGFEIWDVIPGFRSPETGRLLQIDAVLFREGVMPNGN